MKLDFTKYQGAGNDFIMIDCFIKKYEKLDLDQQTVAKLCDRHFGIGADGLILLRKHKTYDFEMVYYNSDGRPSSMCGNGGRCIIDYAMRLKYINEECHFIAVDGPHEGRRLGKNIALKMGDVKKVEQLNYNNYFLDTGSPHYVKFRRSISNMNLVREAHKIRYNERFHKKGTNVNFIQEVDGLLHIRTYERGVEGETLACGTGVVAAALAYAHKKNLTTQKVKLAAIGGNLEVHFDFAKKGYKNIWLIGPAASVFSGTIDC